MDARSPIPKKWPNRCGSLHRHLGKWQEVRFVTGPWQAIQVRHRPRWSNQRLGRRRCKGTYSIVNRILCLLHFVTYERAHIYVYIHTQTKTSIRKKKDKFRGFVYMCAYVPWYKFETLEKHSNRICDFYFYLFFFSVLIFGAVYSYRLANELSWSAHRTMPMARADIQASFHQIPPWHSMLNWLALNRAKLALTIITAHKIHKSTSTYTTT